MRVPIISTTRREIISIIGSGFTGAAVGQGFKHLGYKVIFYDIQEKDLPNFTHDMDEAVHDSDVSFICVPTPTLSNGDLDLSYLETSLANTGRSLRHKNDYHLVVVKSTVLPATTEAIVIPKLEEASGKKAGTDFGVCANPEFMTEISNTWSDDGLFARTVLTEDRIVIGQHDEKAGDLLENIYKPLDIPIWRVDLKTAEMIKYAANCMLATKISYWNEIFLICSNMGIDSQTVAAAVASDPRIGKYGTVHGKAFGGKCLPKDLKAFISMVRSYHQPVLLEAVDAVNEMMRQNHGVRE
ncbi:nucleotide sugar dehydrogenase [Dehalococcoidia bacterium]|nr:nucleotide sugar dehydrogenase [Dehalococcoidia bacterium]